MSKFKYFTYLIILTASFSYAQVLDKDLEDKNIWSNFDNTCLNAKVISTVFKDKKSFICSKPLSVNLIGEREWVSLYDFIEIVRIGELF